jgi:hypothetical protein
VSFTHTMTRTWKGNGGSITLSGKTELVDSQENNLDQQVTNGTTDLSVAYSLVRSKCTSLFIVSNADLTLKTNSSGSPDDTYALLAGIPLAWDEDNYLGLPFGADITTLYLTNASGQNATLKIRVLQHP